MEKMEIDQLLADVERLKSNIKECDDILRTLREIQRNYSSAVSEPKQLLDELLCRRAVGTAEAGKP